MKPRGQSQSARVFLIQYVNHVVPNTMRNSDLSTATLTIPHLTRRAAQAKMRNLLEVALVRCHLGRMGQDRPSRLRLGRNGTAPPVIVIHPASRSVLWGILRVGLCVFCMYICIVGRPTVQHERSRNGMKGLQSAPWGANVQPLGFVSRIVEPDLCKYAYIHYQLFVSTQVKSAKLGIRRDIMPRRKTSSYETPNSILVEQDAYTRKSDNAHILESVGLGDRPATSLQSLLDKVCAYFPRESRLSL